MLTKNFAVGESVYGEKRISVEVKDYVKVLKKFFGLFVFFLLL